MKKIILLILFLVSNISVGQIIRDGAGGSGGLDEAAVQAIVDASLSSVDVLTATHTVNLTSAMTAADIQDSIDAYPKNLGARNLIFQFADGAYSLDATITFDDFYNGKVFVYGKDTDNTSSTTKAVSLDFTNAGFAFNFEDCEASIFVRYLKVNNTSGSNIVFQRCDFITVEYNYILGDNNTDCVGAFATSNQYIRLASNQFGLGLYGIYLANGGQGYALNNTSPAAPNRPQYGNVVEGVCALRLSGTAVLGTASANAEIDGGVIR